jgi:hypothetical protein
MSKQLSDGNPDGTILGQSATDKIGFFGKTGRVQVTFIASLGTTSTTTSVKTALNKVRAALINLGLMAAS